MASWTSAAAYSNVTVAGELGAQGPSPLISAYLTNAIGPGTTVANQIGHVVSVAPSPGPTLFTLFTGLSLAAGTYYLVISGPDNDIALWFPTPGAPTISKAPGVVLNDYGFANDNLGAIDPVYTPASVFQRAALNAKFTVTGTLIPEPSTGLLAATVAVLSLRLRPRREN